MELRHLRYLVAIAEEQSFLKAARRLRVAQSALSKQIQDLEREVGVKLFLRVPRGVILTSAGTEFLREARSTLDNAERAVQSARHAKETADQVFRLGHASLVARAALILKLLADFRSSFPATEVEMCHLDEEELRAALVEQAIDIGATFLAEPVEAIFGSLPLIDCSCTGALLPADHRLARQDRIHVSDLAELTLLSPSSRHHPRICRALFNGLAERGLVVTRKRTLPPDTHTGIMEVAAGGAWVLANEAYGTMYGQITPSIVFRPFIESPIPYQLALIWHQESTSQWVAPMLEIARKYAKVSLVA